MGTQDELGEGIDAAEGDVWRADDDEVLEPGCRVLPHEAIDKATMAKVTLTAPRRAVIGRPLPSRQTTLL